MRHNFTFRILAIAFVSVFLISCGSKEVIVIDNQRQHTTQKSKGTNKTGGDNIDIVVSDSIDDPTIKRAFKEADLNKKQNEQAQKTLEILEQIIKTMPEKEKKTE